MRRLAVWSYAAAVTAWLLWITALPAVLEVRPLSRPSALAAALTYRVGSLVCHQRPERSFRPGGLQVPVCARCTGLYTGAAVGGLIGLAAFGPRRARPSTMSLSRVRVVLVLCAAPTASLWLAEWLAHAPTGNVVRWATAVPLGAAVSWVIALAMAGRSMADTPARSGVH